MDELKFISYNCRGINELKTQYIKTLLGKCNFLLLQEHWMSEGQTCLLSSIDNDFLCTAVSGFDPSSVL